MRKTIYKWFWAWSFQKQEKWLNEMSAMGLQLIDVGFCRYVFEEGNKGEYTVRLQFLDKFPSSAESQQYIQFIEDTGAEHVGSMFRWVYFRKKSSSEGFELFSDMDSHLKHLKGLFTVLSLIAISNLMILLNNLNIFLTFHNSFMMTPLAISLIVVCFLTYGAIRTRSLIRKLKKERNVHE